jgi:hypothetical protein
MFFQILGWIIAAIILLKLTFLCTILMIDGLRKYNIGGVYNKISKKLLLIASAVLLGCIWYQMWQYFPFK